MKQTKGKWFLLVLLLCTAVVAGICVVSTVKVKKKEQTVAALESEVQKKESEQQTQPQTESETQVQTEAKTEVQTETQTEEVSETVTETETESQTAENGHVVAIDPGHQGSWVDMSAQEPSAPGSSETKAKATTGTQGRYTGVPEYQLNLDISLALQKELENRGYRVVMTRTDNDTAISNAERALKAYDEGGEIYVRIHANGSDDGSVSGALGMTPSYDNAYVSDLAGDSYRLTECILNAYCEKTGFANLGIQYHDDMTGINWSKIPVMILEMGFMTNEHDDTAMQDAQMQTSMVNGIADGIDQYFGR
ncbi:MAG: N-acetylmuramoyl-L-alanine amidase [Lachnospiraceae bacterium]|jgi:N-acetylmuramoyl-L-alanine amidase|nr:N-acetylmuramoyl-L-alanine amidase [Lachnospiraceae bacterium]